MALLDWFLPTKREEVKDALADHREATQRVLDALKAGETMTTGQRLDDIRDAFGPKRNGKAK
jgi:hypothetical protein